MESRFGFRVSGFGFRVSGFGFRVSGLRFRVSGFVFRVSDFGFRVLGFGFWVSGFGFRGSRAVTARKRTKEQMKERSVLSESDMPAAPAAAHTQEIGVLIC